MKRYEVTSERIEKVNAFKCRGSDNYNLQYEDGYISLCVRGNLVRQMPTNKKDAIKHQQKIIADKIRFYVDEIRKLSYLLDSCSERELL